MAPFEEHEELDDFLEEEERMEELDAFAQDVELFEEDLRDVVAQLLTAPESQHLYLRERLSNLKHILVVLQTAETRELMAGLVALSKSTPQTSQSLQSTVDFTLEDPTPSTQQT